MSDIFKELDKNSRKDKESILENDVVRNTETLLLNATNKDLEILEKLGLDHEIAHAKQLTSDVTKNRIASKEYESSCYSGKQIKKLCAKYNLRFVPAHKYNGSIPPTLAKEINKFNIQNNLTIKSNAFYILAPAVAFKDDINLSSIKIKPAVFFKFDSDKLSSSRPDNAEEFDQFIPVGNWKVSYNQFMRVVFHFTNTTYQDIWANAGRTALAFVAIAVAIFFTKSPYFIFSFVFWLVAAICLITNYFVKEADIQERWNNTKGL